MSTIPVSPFELVNLDLAVKKLWDLDTNRLNPGTDYVINLQHTKSAFSTTDYAPEPLFSYFNEESLRKPTYHCFLSLLDNYNPLTGVEEVITEEKIEESKRFIDLIYETDCLRYLHQYLLQRSTPGVSEDSNEFKNLLYRLWFTLYQRGESNDSSSFEHVFVGEINGLNGKLVGFHNWIRIYLEEKCGKLNYKGYVPPGKKKRKKKNSVDMVPDGNERVVGIGFSWDGNDHEKLISTSFIGVSPEFELALYTLCFYGGALEYEFHLLKYDIHIRVIPLEENKELIEAVYPTLLGVREDEI